MRAPETEQALRILRDGSAFQWYAIPLFAIVCYVYFVEIKNRNWNGIAAGLALYSVHWFFEIGNALIQHFTGNALWTVPTGTSYLILIGVGIEISFMFAMAGVAISKLLPDSPSDRLLGLNARWSHIIGFSLFYGIIEWLLVHGTPTFVWVYSWWGVIPVAIFVYIPFFWAATYAYYWPHKKQITFIASVSAVDIILIIVFAVWLKWI